MVSHVEDSADAFAVEVCPLGVLPVNTAGKNVVNLFECSGGNGLGVRKF